MPLAATKHTPAGAAAFAKFFIQTIDWAYATTSTTYMRHFAAPDCVGCASLKKAIDGAGSRTRHFIGGRFTIRKLVPGGLGGPNGAETSEFVHFDVTSVEVVDSTGRFIDGQGAFTDYRERPYLRWHNAAWSVVELTLR
jgi:hypothetical protein